MPEKRSKFIRAGARLLTTALVLSVPLQYVILSMTENEVELNRHFAQNFISYNPSLVITERYDMYLAAITAL